ncbi:MAG: hypothetical protein SGPRY_006255, partial [Prymnesium sp.]
MHTRMGATDAICNGRSTFASELSSASEAVARACPRSLLLFDELGRGTATNDGAAIAFATLHHIAREIGCLCLFTTHYPVVSELACCDEGDVALCHMAVVHRPLAWTVPSPPALAPPAPTAPAHTVPAPTPLAPRLEANGTSWISSEKQHIELLFRVTPGTDSFYHPDPHPNHTHTQIISFTLTSSLSPSHSPPRLTLTTTLALTFFRYTPGAGSGSYGLRVGAEAGLPPELLRSAAMHARMLEERAKQRQRDSHLLSLAAKVLRAGYGRPDSSDVAVRSSVGPAILELQ